MRRRGFSLVELLIALAIVAVLVSVLLPALLHARKASQFAVCASNLRQMGGAFQQYVQDWRCFPRADSSSEWRFGGVEFRGADRLAVMDSKRPLNTCYSEQLPALASPYALCFRCPADRGLWRAGDSPQRPGQSVIGDQSCYEFFGNSYRGNINLMDSQMAGVDGPRRALAEHDITVNPARLLVAGDAEWYYGTRRASDPDSGFDASWHADRRGGNMAAWDGSVRYVVFTAETSSMYTLWPRASSIPGDKPFINKD